MLWESRERSKYHQTLHNGKYFSQRNLSKLLVPVLFLLGLNLIQGKLKMKYPEPCKTGAFLWHGFSDFRLIRNPFLKTHIRSLISSMMVHFQYMNLFLDSILMHICVNGCYNSIKVILVQKIAISRRYVSVLYDLTVRSPCQVQHISKLLRKRLVFPDYFPFL